MIPKNMAKSGILQGQVLQNTYYMRHITRKKANFISFLTLQI